MQQFAEHWFWLLFFFLLFYTQVAQVNLAFCVDEFCFGMCIESVLYDAFFFSVGAYHIVMAVANILDIVHPLRLKTHNASEARHVSIFRCNGEM